MKDIIEEYGGVIVACIMGIVLLGVLYFLLAPNSNSLFNLIVKFFASMGVHATK